MADVAKLKKKAAEFEQARKPDKAIAVYREILDAWDGADVDEQVDIALYNRVGDMVMKQGDVAGALELYERAVDRYAEGGFLNNAIALCNKILRQSPGRAIVYYKLGKISAAKGFSNDARTNFLEYAERMQKAGQLDTAFNALKEFADLCPDQFDIRGALADQLLKADRPDEAVAQLLKLHEQLALDGSRAEEAAAVRARIADLDPSAEVTEAQVVSRTKVDDLIFIDLDSPTPPQRQTTAQRLVEVTPPPVTAPPPPAAAAPEPELIVLEPEPEAPALLDLEPTALGDDAPAEPAAGALLGLEPTAFETTDAGPLAGLPSLVDEPVAEAPVRPDLEPTALVDDLLLDERPAPVDVMPASRAADAEPPSVLDDLPLLDVDAGAGATPVGAASTGDGPELVFLGDEGEGDDTGALDLILPDEPAGGGEATPVIEATPAVETFDMLEVDAVAAVAPPPPRRTSVSLSSISLEAMLPSPAEQLDSLRERASRAPADWGLRRALAEALLDAGQREAGLAELDAALSGFEQVGALDEARSVAEEIVRLNPDAIRHHQKRVEYAFRAGDKAALAQAYLDLADALGRDGQGEKARAVYGRVLDIAPDDLRAQAALASLLPEPAAPPAPPPPSRRYTTAVEATRVPAEPSPAAPARPAEREEEFVSLGDWLREDEEPKNTRMVVEEQAPSGDEDADFQDMLRKFKQGVAENVDEADHESHYDLGVAFKEMGLLDEAISEFQKALRGTAQRARTYEALGLCFVEKGQLPVASTILQRALGEPGVGDEQLVGVLYLLGSVAEQLGKAADAKGYYERVFAVDIQFRDVGDRLAAVERQLQ